MNLKTAIYRDKEFWILHATGWIAIFVFVALIALSGVVALGPTLLGVVFYAVFSAVFCFLFSQLYFAGKWYLLTIARQIGRIFLLSLPLGFLFGFGFASIIRVFGIDTYGATRVVSPDLSPSDLFFITAGNNTTIFAFLMIAWSILYIGVFHFKRAAQIEQRSIAMERDLREARVNLLTGQLKPHFLFNALNNILFTMDVNVEKSKDMLVGFSDILRYSLESHQKEKVSVEKELQVVRQYIDLIKVQFEDRVVCRVEVDPACDRALIPPMILQLLVENAVKHGIDNNYHEGRIWITGRVQDEALAFEVVNDVSIASENHFDSPGGVGLRNIRKRLSLLYGTRASFDIRQESRMVTAKFSIPMEVCL